MQLRRPVVVVRRTAAPPPAARLRGGHHGLPLGVPDLPRVDRRDRLGADAHDECLSTQHMLSAHNEGQRPTATATQ